jgi:ectoine hydroxylase-related dioxygenase (phytanoyl-CoA dioxygenase family)
VFYLDADPNKGNLHLEDPTHFCKERMPYDWQKKPYVFTEEITAEAGKIVMFPGYLMHHVRSNKSTSNRIAFGFNFGLSWQYKARPY